MSLNQETAGTIINDALVECGLSESQDPFGDPDDAVRQMTRLLTTAGRMLVKMHPWSFLQREHIIVTAENDTGIYDLPEDFDRMIDQTGWSRDQKVRLPGSTSPQTWQYLKGRNLVSSTIYAVFRELDHKFILFPQPPEAPVPWPLTMAFEYIRRLWLVTAETVGSQDPVYASRATQTGDLILFDSVLMMLALKYRFKVARGAEATGARDEFLFMFQSITGQDVSKEPLRMDGGWTRYPYLNNWCNSPDSGYGL